MYVLLLYCSKTISCTSVCVINMHLSACAGHDNIGEKAAAAGAATSTVSVSG